jgi:hypothetical protein
MGMKTAGNRSMAWCPWPLSDTTPPIPTLHARAAQLPGCLACWMRTAAAPVFFRLCCSFSGGIRRLLEEQHAASLLPSRTTSMYQLVRRANTKTRTPSRRKSCSYPVVAAGRVFVCPHIQLDRSQFGHQDGRGRPRCTTQLCSLRDTLCCTSEGNNTYCSVFYQITVIL